MSTFILKNNKGFTIIETLVAITILMIAIAGPLTIAHKGLLAAVYSKDQLTASYLAQDAMEYVKNIRDNNLLDSSLPWLRGIDHCSYANPCSVDTVNGDPSTGVGGTGPTGDGLVNCGTTCTLSLDSNDSYVPISGTNPQFSRTFYILPGTNAGQEVKLVVTITWASGGSPAQVVYENQIYNVLR